MYLRADPAWPKPGPPVQQPRPSQITLAAGSMDADLGWKAAFIKAQLKLAIFPARIINYSNTSVD